MPLLSGEYGGVVHISKPISAPNARVSSGVKMLPLSDSHSMGAGRRRMSVRIPDALEH